MRTLCTTNGRVRTAASVDTRICCHQARPSTSAAAPKSRRSFANGVLRNLLRKRDDESLPTLSDDESLTRTQRLAIETSTPNWLLSDLSAGNGAPLASFDDLEAWAHASQERPPITLRINRKRTTRDRVAEELTAHGLSVEPVDGLADALLLERAVARSPRCRDLQTAFGVCRTWARNASRCWRRRRYRTMVSRGASSICALRQVGRALTSPSSLAMVAVLSVEVHARKARLIEQSCARLGHAEAVDVQVADATDATALQGLLESKRLVRWCGRGRRSTRRAPVWAPCAAIRSIVAARPTQKRWTP